MPIFRIRVAVALGFWAALYAAYRFYYALGGHVGMFGRPASAAEFRRINLIGGTIILLAVVLPADCRGWSVFAVSGLQPSSRRAWLRSALMVGGLAYAFGVLTGLGAAPSFRYG